MAKSNEQVVRDFCAAWSRKDATSFSAISPTTRSTTTSRCRPWSGRTRSARSSGCFSSVGVDRLGDAARGQRGGRRVHRTGRSIRDRRQDRCVAVAGVFELEGGLIKAWRDYFDMATWQRQTGGQ